LKTTISHRSRLLVVEWLDDTKPNAGKDRDFAPGRERSVRRHATPPETSGAQCGVRAPFTDAPLRNWPTRSNMPRCRELTFHLEDQPGSLAKICRALADRGVIFAFQSVISEGKGRIRCMVDNPTAAKKVLDDEGLSYTETEVAQGRLRHRPGELARAALRLGEANININDACCWGGRWHEHSSHDFWRQGSRAGGGDSGSDGGRGSGGASAFRGCRNVGMVRIAGSARPNMGDSI
jgi:hypothetical protein